MSDRERGLYGKYHVTRNDGSSEPGGKHEHCQYFVLDLTHDEHAVSALETYAESCSDDYPALYDDLQDILASLLKRRCLGRCKEKHGNLCQNPAVIPMGNGVWLCEECAPSYLGALVFEGIPRDLISRTGKASLQRRQARRSAREKEVERSR